MNSQVYSVPDQKEGRSKAFLEWTSIDLYSKLPLKCESNFDFYKSHNQDYVHNPIPTQAVRIGNTLPIFKTNQ